jgi:phosphoenolpyruvate phosphomutase
MKKVYVGMSMDIIHHGHINILEHAREYGNVVVGLLTDSAIADHKRLPYLTYDQRKKVVQNIQGVYEVVPQEEWDYSSNIRKYRPDYMVHGDDWVHGPESGVRSRVLAALAEYGGELIEIPYTNGVSSTGIANQQTQVGTTAEIRRQTLRRLLSAKKICRFIEAHSPLSALISENAKEKVDNKILSFDGFWSSSLTDSTEMGKPDIEALDISDRLSNIDDIFEVTSKPLIMDADTGGKAEHFEFYVRSMERLGISAVIIEDKTGLKKNSLLGNDVKQTQEDIAIFSEKIRMGKKALVDSDFMIIARVESLILEKGMDDAIQRARSYVKAGADGVMIHSRQKKPDEVFEFSDIFKKEFPDIPLVCVPTSYNQVTEDELSDHGFNMVIYANQMLRASYPAMSRVAHSILKNSRSLEVDNELISISEILKLIPGTE